MQFIKFIVFALIFVYTTMWTQINLLLGSLGQKNSPVTIVQNDTLRKLIRDKTGIDIATIKISESNRPFGMMIGIPSKPQLVLSRGLYNTFSPSEMEYVVLHEAGHYVLWHSVIELLAGTVLLVAGVLILKRIPQFPISLLCAVLFGIVFGVVMIRLGRIHEYQADRYSAQHMTNPQGMIDATNKFRGFYGKSLTENKNKVIQALFYRGNPYDNRIKMAQTEISARKN